MNDLEKKYLIEKLHAMLGNTMIECKRVLTSVNFNFDTAFKILINKY